MHARDEPRTAGSGARPRLLVVCAADTQAELRRTIESALAPVYDSEYVSAGDMVATRAAANGIAGTIVAVRDRDEAIVSWLDALRTQRPTVPTLAIVPADASPDLLRTVSQATDDFLCEPVRRPEFDLRVTRLCGTPRYSPAAVRERMIEQAGMARLLGHDPAFLRAIEQIPRYARVDIPVLITGETGTGKELCARALHHLSSRRQRAFVAANCGAVPDTLFENELFGHRRGAFTDARHDHPGLIAMSDGGTLFLDELDSLSLSSQQTLLRFLQDGSFYPLGSAEPRQANVRVLAATNRDVEASVRDTTFRQDLYYRLNVLRLHMPPLRERRDDIAVLADQILSGCRLSMRTTARDLSAAALQVLRAHAWPGNIRELHNVLQRAALSCDGDLILPSHLSLPTPDTSSSNVIHGAFRNARAAAIAAFERQYVEDLLRKHDGNVTHAAREAQQDRRAFGRFLKKYNILRQRRGA